MRRGLPQETVVASSDTFSFSRVTTFEQCPRRYRYRYVDGIREAFQSIEAFMGQQVHGAVEWLFAEKRQGREPSAGDAVARYCTDFDRGYNERRAAVRVVRSGTEAEEYRRAGAEMLADFHRRRFLADRFETVGLEQHFAMELAPGRRFQGYIDRLARDQDGHLHIIDFKTGARTPARFEGKDADQLDAYAVATFDRSDAAEVTLRLEYLRSGRTLTKRITREETVEVRRRLAARIAEAASATVFPPVPGSLCDWCGFNDLCEAYPKRRAASVRG